jgi:HK97 gp10 family phage protein
MTEEFNHFDDFFTFYDEAVRKTVKAAAFKIERGAKQRAPVDTGFLRNSIYVKTETDSDNRVSGAEAFPEVDIPEHNAAYIAVGARYGIFVEYGTSRMGAQPFFTPAIEAEREPFFKALDRLMNQAKAQGFDLDVEGG